MRIHGLTVCVNYADLFARGLPRWVQGLSSLTVVTSHSDFAAQALCRRWPIHVFQTDSFYANGAAFNKGLAMEEARRFMPWEDWILFFDADIIPPVGWADHFVEGSLRPGFLYGAPRLEALTPEHIDNPLRPRLPDDRMGYGYFQLFHSRDPRVQQKVERDGRLLDIQWKHAGNYDSNFMLLWPETRELPLTLWHLGARGNWFGRDAADDFASLMVTRRGGGIHPSEKL